MILEHLLHHRCSRKRIDFIVPPNLRNTRGEGGGKTIAGSLLPRIRMNHLVLFPAGSGKHVVQANAGFVQRLPVISVFYIQKGKICFFTMIKGKIIFSDDFDLRDGRSLIDLHPIVPVSYTHLLIRFDAFAYASKKPGTSCFFVEPEIWDVLDIAMKPLRKTGTQMLAEIHENYRIQQKMAERGYWVYDFALPMLLLHATITGRSDRLIHWMNICPRNQFTTLDTHDGVGVIDAAGLLEEEEIETVAEKVESRTALAQKYIQNGSMIRKGGKLSLIHI